jgi:hypothetical protein
MSFGVTAEGFVLKTLSDILSEVNNAQLGSISSSLNLDGLGIRAQMVHPLCAQLAKLWELAQSVYASGDANQALDFSLVQLCALTGTSLSPEQPTSVLGLVELAAGAALPVGACAHISRNPALRFKTRVAVVNETGSTAFFKVLFFSETNGPLAVSLGELDTIAEPQTGWISVTNEETGVLGSTAETNQELRLKRQEDLQASGSTTLASIIDAVRAVPGANNVSGIENDTNKALEADGQPPGTIQIFMREGAATASIAQAIFLAKAGGAPTFGNTSDTYTDDEGTEHTVYFTVLEPYELFVEYILTTTSDYAGPQATDNALVLFFEGFANAQPVIYNQVLSFLMGLAGVVDVTFLAVGLWSAYPTPITGNITVPSRAFANLQSTHINWSPS